MYSIRSDRPLDGITKDIVRQFNDACDAMSRDYFLIGATARDILLTHVFGGTPDRATRDVDFALAIPDWATFKQIKAWFLEQPEVWSASTMPHRLLYRASGMNYPVAMDIVPFGAIEQQPISKVIQPHPPRVHTQESVCPQ